MNRLKDLRTSLGMSQLSVALQLGVSQQAYANYERGAREADYNTLNKLAQIFNTSIDYIIGNADIPQSSGITVPVLGYVAAGIPIEAIEDILDYEELDPRTFNPSYQYFGLKIKGNSMTPRIQDGDVVIVRCQPDIESGEIAIVCVNGDNATCKQVKKQKEGVSLIPFNPAYDVKFYTNKEIEELPVTILGKVVELRGKF